MSAGSTASAPYDSTLPFLREGYPFISSRCDGLGTDLFTSRLLLQTVTFLRGADAAELFYDGSRVTRQGAVPRSVRHLLQDDGSVQSLDGDAHHRRKFLFLSLMTAEATDRLGDLFDEEWARTTAHLRPKERFRLRDLSRAVLTRAALRWSGIPVGSADIPRLTTDLSMMVDRAGRFGPANWNARRRRRTTERWIVSLVERVREGTLSPPPGTALEVLSSSADIETAEIAAVEVLNILRPILAVAVFIEFAATALVQHPRFRADFADGAEDDLEPFIQEVRRFYPFFPAVPGRVLEPFSWRGHRFREHDRVVLDLYGTCHDRRIFPDPDSFRPERFRGWSWAEDPNTLIAQGAGRHEDDHRCPGEGSTVELLARAVRVLSRSELEAPPQDLSIPLDRFPTGPRSGVVLALP
jgi:fatty-acid peroxygenase